MNDNLNNSGYEAEPSQEYFTKFLNRFFKEPWFDKPNYLLVFMHLLKNVNWHPSTIIYKNENFIVNTGECIISQTKLANELKIPKSSVHEILKYFENVKEIRTRSTNAFTLVSITYLTEKNKTERQQNANRTPTDASLDNIDKEVENSLNFIKENNSKERKTDMKTKSKTNNKIIGKAEKKLTSVKEINKPISFIDTLLEVWSEEYYLSRQIKYVLTKGKDRGGISNLLNLFKSEHSDLDTAGMINYFRNFCKQVFAIEDPFIYENCNPAFINSQINKVRIILLKPKHKKSYSSVGQANADCDYNLPLK
ncbi:MAG: hypothetical protein RO257_14565 [Candidatus Kapabacteria bacterium]|jgi:hypothetical protein|nr:hypothetical protein [Candidatus Kapabacteria bacterium]